MEHLKIKNNKINPNKIYVGQKIEISTEICKTEDKEISQTPTKKRMAGSGM